MQSKTADWWYLFIFFLCNISGRVSSRLANYGNSFCWEALNTFQQLEPTKQPNELGSCFVQTGRERSSVRWAGILHRNNSLLPSYLCSHLDALQCALRVIHSQNGQEIRSNKRKKCILWACVIERRTQFILLLTQGFYPRTRPFLVRENQNPSMFFFFLRFTNLADNTERNTKLQKVFYLNLLLISPWQCLASCAK